MTPQPMDGILHRLVIAPSLTAKRPNIDAMFTTGKSPIDSGKRRIRAKRASIFAPLPPRFRLRLVDRFAVHTSLKIELSLKPLVKLRFNIGTDYRNKFVTYSFDLFVVGCHLIGSFLPIKGSLKE
jgi:hypothetical protein